MGVTPDGRAILRQQQPWLTFQGKDTLAIVESVSSFSSAVRIVVTVAPLPLL
jgi:hypothetical protein